MSVKLLLNNVAQEKTPTMWIGWIPQDLDGTGIGITKEEEMGEEFGTTVMNFGLVSGTLQEMEVQELVKYPLNLPEAVFMCAILPKGYAAYFDNGFGDKVTFSQADGINGDYVQNGMLIKEQINNQEYYLYGIMFNTNATFYFYVEAV